ncbi:uncharacterized protein LOC124157362 [Ischnura elegans]|uniref:uncharacterized protein LOC124157362 n=1 Tax=Ischnura elegans TaxID=197161 RepID=UPI001ED88C24|nr:uncharacterized protein LOC124157362 [Ischnura elegans]XP_046387983.1 uncharacterized protein LOC124157362 [Ischnura elegans]
MFDLIVSERMEEKSHPSPKAQRRGAQVGGGEIVVRRGPPRLSCSSSSLQASPSRSPGHPYLFCSPEMKNHSIRANKCKAASFQQRFRNMFRRCAGTEGAGESRFGPAGGPFEAVAIHSRLRAGDPSAAGGCSGFLWRQGGHTWGLTHGSAILPLLEVGTDDILKDVMEVTRDRIPGLPLPESFENLEFYVQRESGEDFVASVVGAWSCRSLSEAFGELQSSGWEFLQEGDTDELLILKFILSMFVVFRPVQEEEETSEMPSTPAALATLLDRVHHSGLSRGSPVLLVSSPFTGVATSENKASHVRGRHCRDGGSFRQRDGIDDRDVHIIRKDFSELRSPFMNSWSQGVVSGDCITGSRSLFLTDARATGGSEGGPIFARCSGDQWKLAGMLLKSICYWRGEWVGFSLACYLEPSLQGFLKIGIPGSIGENDDGSVGEDELHALYAIASCPVVLVKCGYTQGTGVPINGSQGLILTCAHVVRKHHLGLEVSWLKGKKSATMKADVVYLTAPDFAYDVAIISVGPGTDLQTIHISNEMPQQGDAVWLVGYAMHSGPSKSSELDSPLVSRGIISSVMPGKLPPLLQTTCCVQGGSSGGAVIREDGTLVGLMVCNTAVEQFFPGSSKSKVVIHPSINFAIPAITLSDVLTRYYETKDASVLNEFQCPDDGVQQVWKLRVPEPRRSKL